MAGRQAHKHTMSHKHPAKHRAGRQAARQVKSKALESKIYGKQEKGYYFCLEDGFLHMQIKYQHFLWGMHDDWPLAFIVKFTKHKF